MTAESITLLLEKLNQGEKDSLDAIYSQLYTEIKAIASNQISQLNNGQTITPTVMANECYLIMAKKNKIKVKDRRHFLNYLAKCMRALLIDIFRGQSSQKRKHLKGTANFSQILGQKDIDIAWLEVDYLLTKVEKINPKYSELIEFKLIFDLTFKEISELINKSERQVMRVWSQAVTLMMALSQEHQVDGPQN